ncbi:MAG: hypothetical protein LBL00_02760, partial [Endomicrobium sp.]|nr:hypothetical protein [Endomicrobium sp.]
KTSIENWKRKIAEVFHADILIDAWIQAGAGKKITFTDVTDFIGILVDAPGTILGIQNRTNAVLGGHVRGSGAEVYSSSSLKQVFSDNAYYPIFTPIKELRLEIIKRFRDNLSGRYSKKERHHLNAAVLKMTGEAQTDGQTQTDAIQPYYNSSPIFDIMKRTGVSPEDMLDNLADSEYYVNGLPKDVKAGLIKKYPYDKNGDKNVLEWAAEVFYDAETKEVKNEIKLAVIQQQTEDIKNSRKKGSRQKDLGRNYGYFRTFQNLVEEVKKDVGDDDKIIIQAQKLIEEYSDPKKEKEDIEESSLKELQGLIGMVKVVNKEGKEKSIADIWEGLGNINITDKNELKKLLSSVDNDVDRAFNMFISKYFYIGSAFEADGTFIGYYLSSRFDNSQSSFAGWIEVNKSVGKEEGKTPAWENAQNNKSGENQLNYESLFKGITEALKSEGVLQDDFAFTPEEYYNLHIDFIISARDDINIFDNALSLIRKYRVSALTHSLEKELSKEDQGNSQLKSRLTAAIYRLLEGSPSENDIDLAHKLLENVSFENITAQTVAVKTVKYFSDILPKDYKLSKELEQAIVKKYNEEIKTDKYRNNKMALYDLIVEEFAGDIIIEALDQYRKKDNYSSKDYLKLIAPFLADFGGAYVNRWARYGSSKVIKDVPLTFNARGGVTVGYGSSASAISAIVASWFFNSELASAQLRGELSGLIEEFNKADNKTSYYQDKNKQTLRKWIDNKIKKVAIAAFRENIPEKYGVEKLSGELENQLANEFLAQYKEASANTSDEDIFKTVYERNKTAILRDILDRLINVTPSKLEKASDKDKKDVNGIFDNTNFLHGSMLKEIRIKELLEEIYEARKNAPEEKREKQKKQLEKVINKAETYLSNKELEVFKNIAQSEFEALREEYPKLGENIVYYKLLAKHNYNVQALINALKNNDKEALKIPNADEFINPMKIFTDIRRDLAGFLPEDYDMSDLLINDMIEYFKNNKTAGLTHGQWVEIIKTVFLSDIVIDALTQYKDKTSVNIAKGILPLAATLSGVVPAAGQISNAIITIIGALAPEYMSRSEEEFFKRLSPFDSNVDDLQRLYNIKARKGRVYDQDYAREIFDNWIKAVEKDFVKDEINNMLETAYGVKLSGKQLNALYEEYNKAKSLNDSKREQIVNVIRNNENIAGEILQKTYKKVKHLGKKLANKKDLSPAEMIAVNKFRASLNYARDVYEQKYGKDKTNEDIVKAETLEYEFRYVPEIIETEQQRWEELQNQEKDSLKTELLNALPENYQLKAEIGEMIDKYFAAGYLSIDRSKNVAQNLSMLLILSDALSRITESQEVSQTEALFEEIEALFEALAKIEGSAAATLNKNRDPLQTFDEKIFSKAQIKSVNTILDGSVDAQNIDELIKIYKDAASRVVDFQKNLNAKISSTANKTTAFGEIGAYFQSGRELIKTQRRLMEIITGLQKIGESDKFPSELRSKMVLFNDRFFQRTVLETEELEDKASKLTTEEVKEINEGITETIKEIFAEMKILPENYKGIKSAQLQELILLDYLYNKDFEGFDTKDWIKSVVAAELRSILADALSSQLSEIKKERNLYMTAKANMAQFVKLAAVLESIYNAPQNIITDEEKDELAEAKKIIASDKKSDDLKKEVDDIVLSVLKNAEVKNLPDISTLPEELKTYIFSQYFGQYLRQYSSAVRAGIAPEINEEKAAEEMLRTENVKYNILLGLLNAEISSENPRRLAVQNLLNELKDNKTGINTAADLENYLKDKISLYSQGTLRRILQGAMEDAQGINEEARGVLNKAMTPSEELYLLMTKGKHPDEETKNTILQYIKFLGNFSIDYRSPEVDGSVSLRLSWAPGQRLEWEFNYNVSADLRQIAKDIVEALKKKQTHESQLSEAVAEEALKDEVALALGKYLPKNYKVPDLINSKMKASFYEASEDKQNDRENREEYIKNLARIAVENNKINILTDALNWQLRESALDLTETRNIFIGLHDALKDNKDDALKASVNYQVETMLKYLKNNYGVDTEVLDSLKKAFAEGGDLSVNMPTVSRPGNQAPLQLRSFSESDLIRLHEAIRTQWNDYFSAWFEISLTANPVGSEEYDKVSYLFGSDDYDVALDKFKKRVDLCYAIEHSSDLLAIFQGIYGNPRSQAGHEGLVDLLFRGGENRSLQQAIDLLRETVKMQDFLTEVLKDADIYEKLFGVDLNSMSTGDKYTSLSHLMDNKGVEHGIGMWRKYLGLYNEIKNNYKTMFFDTYGYDIEGDYNARTIDIFNSLLFDGYTGAGDFGREIGEAIKQMEARSDISYLIDKIKNDPTYKKLFERWYQINLDSATEKELFETTAKMMYREDSKDNLTHIQAFMVFELQVYVYTTIFDNKGNAGENFRTRYPEANIESADMPVYINKLLFGDDKDGNDNTILILTGVKQDPVTGFWEYETTDLKQILTEDNAKNIMDNKEKVQEAVIQKLKIASELKKLIEILNESESENVKTKAKALFERWYEVKIDYDASNPAQEAAVYEKLATAMFIEYEVQDESGNWQKKYKSYETAADFFEVFKKYVELYNNIDDVDGDGEMKQRFYDLYMYGTDRNIASPNWGPTDKRESIMNYLTRLLFYEEKYGATVDKNEGDPGTAIKKLEKASEIARFIQYIIGDKNKKAFFEWLSKGGDFYKGFSDKYDFENQYDFNFAAAFMYPNNGETYYDFETSKKLFETYSSVYEKITKNKEYKEWFKTAFSLSDADLKIGSDKGERVNKSLTFLIIDGEKTAAENTVPYADDSEIIEKLEKTAYIQGLKNRINADKKTRDFFWIFFKIGSFPTAEAALTADIFDPVSEIVSIEIEPLIFNKGEFIVKKDGKNRNDEDAFKIMQKVQEFYEAIKNLSEEEKKVACISLGINNIDGLHSHGGYDILVGKLYKIDETTNEDVEIDVDDAIETLKDYKHIADLREAIINAKLESFYEKIFKHKLNNFAKSNERLALLLYPDGKLQSISSVISLMEKVKEFYTFINGNLQGDDRKWQDEMYGRNIGGNGIQNEKVKKALLDTLRKMHESRLDTLKGDKPFDVNNTDSPEFYQALAMLLADNSTSVENIFDELLLSEFITFYSKGMLVKATRTDPQMGSYFIYKTDANRNLPSGSAYDLNPKFYLSQRIGGNKNINSIYELTQALDSFLKLTALRHEVANWELEENKTISKLLNLIEFGFDHDAALSIEDQFAGNTIYWILPGGIKVEPMQDGKPLKPEQFLSRIQMSLLWSKLEGGIKTSDGKTIKGSPNDWMFYYDAEGGEYAGTKRGNGLFGVQIDPAYYNNLIMTEPQLADAIANGGKLEILKSKYIESETGKEYPADEKTNKTVTKVSIETVSEDAMAFWEIKKEYNNGSPETRRIPLHKNDGTLALSNIEDIEEAFEAASAIATMAVGTVLYKGGKFYIYDSKTGETIEAPLYIGKNLITKLGGAEIAIELYKTIQEALEEGFSIRQQQTRDGIVWYVSHPSYMMVNGKPMEFKYSPVLLTEKEDASGKGKTKVTTVATVTNLKTAFEAEFVKNKAQASKISIREVREKTADGIITKWVIQSDMYMYRDESGRYRRVEAEVYPYNDPKTLEQGQKAVLQTEELYGALALEQFKKMMESQYDIELVDEDDQYYKLKDAKGSLLHTFSKKNLVWKVKEKGKDPQTAAYAYVYPMFSGTDGKLKIISADDIAISLKSQELYDDVIAKRVELAKKAAKIADTDKEAIKEITEREKMKLIQMTVKQEDGSYLMYWYADVSALNVQKKKDEDGNVITHVKLYPVNSEKAMSYKDAADFEKSVKIIFDILTIVSEYNADTKNKYYVAQEFRKNKDKEGVYDH